MKYEYKMEIPVMIEYSLRDDNSVSIDAICAPPEDEIYSMIDKHAAKIKAGAYAQAKEDEEAEE